MASASSCAVLPVALSDATADLVATTPAALASPSSDMMCLRLNNARSPIHSCAAPGTIRRQNRRAKRCYKGTSRLQETGGPFDFIRLNVTQRGGVTAAVFSIYTEKRAAAGARS